LDFAVKENWEVSMIFFTSATEYATTQLRPQETSKEEKKGE